MKRFSEMQGSHSRNSGLRLWELKVYAFKVFNSWVCGISGSFRPPFQSYISYAPLSTFFQRVQRHVVSILSLKCAKCRLQKAKDFHSYLPRGSTYTTIRELGPIIPSMVWYLGPDSLIVVYMDPLG